MPKLPSLKNCFFKLLMGGLLFACNKDLSHSHHFSTQSQSLVDACKAPFVQNHEELYSQLTQELTFYNIGLFRSKIYEKEGSQSLSDLHEFVSPALAYTLISEAKKAIRLRVCEESGQDCSQHPKPQIYKFHRCVKGNAIRNDPSQSVDNCGDFLKKDRKGYEVWKQDLFEVKLNLATHVNDDKILSIKNYVEE